MDIWILNHYASPPDRPVATRHYDLARRWVDQGHQVTIFASGFNHWTREYDRLSPGEMWRQDDVEGVQFIWVRTPPYRKNDFGRLRNMLSYSWNVLHVSRGFASPDVVVGSSVHPFAGLAGYLLARRYATPFVFEVRDLWPQTLVDMGILSAHHPLVLFLRFLETFLYRRADRIITLLPTGKEYIASRSRNLDNIDWIPNGVDSEPFLRAETSRAACIEPRFIAMYLGAHGEANGLHVLVEAAAHVQRMRPDSNIGFVFVGEGPEKPHLRELARRLSLDNVEFRDGVPRDQVAATLAQTSVLIFHLMTLDVFRYGISSNKLFSYLASAKPIVFACDASFNPVEASGAGLTVPPEDPEALAKAVLQLYDSDEASRGAMGQCGRAYVERYHDLDNLAAAFLGSLQHAAESYDIKRQRTVT